MRVRQLNEQGIERFEAFLGSLTTPTTSPLPRNLLTDESTSTPFDFDIEVEDQKFANRFEAASYFDGLFGNLDTEIQMNVGLWSWLSLFYFEQICAKKGGHFTPGQNAHWILAATDPFRYYRHYLAGSWQIFHANRDDPKRAMIFLCAPVETVGHFYYQLVSRMEYITNKSIVQLATDLYFDAETGRQKRGAQTRGKPGTVFRFTSFLNQLDRTWDLYSMSTAELKSRLPSEFDRFLRPV